MLRTRNLLLISKRCKGGKEHWSVLQRKVYNTDRALESFDDFYGSVYGKRWLNMREALLTKRKYIALVNNFGDTEQTCSILENDGGINVKALVMLAKERLVERNLSNNKKAVNKVDKKLEQLIRQQEEREKAALYPEGTPEEPTQIPEQLHYGNTSEASDAQMNTNFDGKAGKSLEQSLEEDMQIDHTRLVDPMHATGALYDYLPANNIKGMEDWIPESAHYKYYQTNADFPLNIEPEKDFSFPEHLHLYTYEMDNDADFQEPKRCITGVMSHYLMDGASVLPPIFLNVKYGERVLDACAAPGGKSLVMLQTLLPNMLVCNDIQESRVNRIRSVMRDYLFDFKERWDGQRIMIVQSDARNMNQYESYDKILVDVPCTTDRHSVLENDNNIFKPTRIKERLRLPELQAGILLNCLRLLVPGGSLVYSTCSLSPVQNDGVVHMALQKAFHEHNITTTINDLSYATRLFRDIFKFESPKNLKYGQMVIPYLPANFGPMYFSKITRNA